MDLRFGAVLVSHPHLAEIVLRKLPGKAFEPYQRCHRPDAQRLHQGIHRALPPGVPGLPRSMQQLHRPQSRVLGQCLHEHRAIGLGLRGAAHLAARVLCRVIDGGDWIFYCDPSGSLLGDAAERRDLAPRVLRAAQDLNLVSLEHVDHPFPRRKLNLRRFSDPAGLPVGGQNFRKGLGQNFRNPQSQALERLDAALTKFLQEVRLVA